MCVHTYIFVCILLHKVDVDQLSEPPSGVTNSYSLSCEAIFDVMVSGCHLSGRDVSFQATDFGSYCVSSAEDWLR